MDNNKYCSKCEYVIDDCSILNKCIDSQYLTVGNEIIRTEWLIELMYVSMDNIEDNLKTALEVTKSIEIN